VPTDPGASISRASATAAGAGAPNASGSAGGLGELEGIRPYVPGDRLSLLHWPSKARYGTWFVRQFGGEGSASLPLVIDDRAGVHRRADFDRLTAATLWTVDEALRAGQPVAFYTLSGQIASFEPTDQGRADVRLLLAGLQPRPAQSSAWSRVEVPADAALFTTRTGAERLAGSRAIAQEYGTAHRSDLTPRLVVI
jgi:uncharacterized protein (DUF58 family)